MYGPAIGVVFIIILNATTLGMGACSDILKDTQRTQSTDPPPAMNCHLSLTQLVRPSVVWCGVVGLFGTPTHSPVSFMNRTNTDTDGSQESMWQYTQTGAIDLQKLRPCPLIAAPRTVKSANFVYRFMASRISMMMRCG